MDERHNEKYFLFHIWKNATWEDFQNPEKFIRRYTDFIQDHTFEKYEQKTKIGQIDQDEIYAQRIEDDYGFETPYIFQYSIQRGEESYSFPAIRFGISKNRMGGKIAYIYAVQGKKDAQGTTCQEEIRSFCNRANQGVKHYRNVSPSAIVALTMFLGMLEKEGIQAIKAPVFLVGRYGRFLGAETQEETNEIQTNLTNRFLRNFLRLSDQFSNVEILPFMNDGYDSFLRMTLGKMDHCSQAFLEKLYKMGRQDELEIKDEPIER